jgi:hypothetical protein
VENAHDQDVLPYRSIINAVTAIALDAILPARTRVTWSNVGEVHQALQDAFQAVDIDAGLILAEVDTGPLEDRSKIGFGPNRKDKPRADIWLEAR